jgi:ribonucleoside-diphosphate reductase alpha chain
MPTATAARTVVKRDGETVPFDPAKITRAVELCLTRSCGQSQAAARPIAEATTRDVVRRLGRTVEVGIETIQDFVVVSLMANAHFTAATEYILYRENRRRQRVAAEGQRGLQIVGPLGALRPFDPGEFRRMLYVADCPPELVEETADTAAKQLYDGITEQEAFQALLMTARDGICRDLRYDAVARNLLLDDVYRTVLAKDSAELSTADYEAGFLRSLAEGVEHGRYAAALTDGRFDLPGLAMYLAANRGRDRDFLYAGLQNLSDRYLRRVGRRHIETPQYFYMRVVMGVALSEADPTARAIEFYEELSSHRYSPGTPTLFNSATLHPQLSSCFLTVVDDDLRGIFKAVVDNAMLSKWAGGLGNSWTMLRASKATVKGTGGASKGPIPFMRVASTAAHAVTQGEIRKGAVCGYVEPWHLDFEAFLELRRGTGDERLRTHDMHTAGWMPDLFMKRVLEDADWTLFCPGDCPDLHELHGRAFEARYLHYEAEAAAGRLRHKTVRAMELWQKWLTLLRETGHPWVTFKDACNVRSPQDHVGVVHSSNLCTEITLNTSPARLRETVIADDGSYVQTWDAGETAVCNLGSVNLAAFLVRDEITDAVSVDWDGLARTIRVAMRMLDNVIDESYYPTPEARVSNRRHRPVGLGQMGFQDVLDALGVAYDSDDAVEVAGRVTEFVAFHAIAASADLARERGPYSTYKGSKWDRGLLPHDTLALLERERGRPIRRVYEPQLDWAPVREAVRAHGMRNSNTMAIAPTATIAGLIGVRESIEPNYKLINTRVALGGEFVVVQRAFAEACRDRGLWSKQLVDALIQTDGQVGPLDLPEDLKARFKSAFEFSPEWLIRAAAARQMFIDQAQSLNLYMSPKRLKDVSDAYVLAWDLGLKTTYYLRTLGATSAEKVTVAAVGDTSRRDTLAVAAPACRLDDPTCEACQ